MEVERGGGWAAVWVRSGHLMRCLGLIQSCSHMHVHRGSSCASCFPTHRMYFLNIYNMYKLREREREGARAWRERGRLIEGG